MPEMMQYLEPNDPLREDTSSTVMTKERRERTEAFKKARAYYEGRHKVQLDRKPDEPDDNVVINAVRMTIDRTLSFLFPQMPALELDPRVTEETPEETWLRRAWQINGGVSFLHDVALNGCLSGHSYVRIVPAKFEGDFPRLINLDPTSIITYWKSDDVDTVLWHEIYWTVMKVFNGQQIVTEEHLQDIINDENNRQWVVREFTRISGGKWTEDTTASQLWQSRFGPIIHWKHLPNPNRFYGKPETTHLALNDSLNLIMSENARINRYHASPKTVATGVAPDKIKETAIDDLWATENDKAEIYNLEMQSDQAFSQYLSQFLFDAYLSESRVVILKGEVKDFQRVTNAGVRTVFIDMLSKNVVLRQQYGTAIQQISQRMGLLGLDRDDLVPDVIHSDPLPTDNKELIDIAAIERSIGSVSRQTVAEERGRNWEDEKARMEEEAKLPMFQAPTAQPPKPGGGAGIAQKEENM